MRTFYIIVYLSISTNLSAQFTPTFAYKASAIKLDSYYYKSEIIVRNPNDTYDYYIIHNYIDPIAHTISLRSFGKNHLEDDKINFGYSLGIGLQHFRSSSTLQYNYSSTTYQDSIINALDGYTYNTNYTMVFSNHFIDFNWNVSDKVRLSQSLGFGIFALM